MKILHNLCLHFARQDGQDRKKRKENHATKVTTLDSGINVAHGITVAPPLKNFHIMILILFYINLGIAVIF